MALYLGLGWLGLVSVLMIRGWLGPHETFHFAVIAGVLIHWIFIRSLIRRAPAVREVAQARLSDRAGDGS